MASEFLKCQKRKTKALLLRARRENQWHERVSVQNLFSCGGAKSETQTCRCESARPGCRRRRRGPSKTITAEQSTRECTRRRNPTLCWFLCMCNFEDKHRIRHGKRPLGRVYLPTRHLLMWACSIIMARRTIFLCGARAHHQPDRHIKKLKLL